MTDIFGLELESTYTAIDVRGALVTWFAKTHGELIEKRAKASDMPADKVEAYTRNEVEYIVKLQFQRLKYDFDKPTKESLFYVALSLVAIAKAFKGADIMCSNLLDLLKLIDKL